jgi:hypothetical protein
MNSVSAKEMSRRRARGWKGRRKTIMRHKSLAKPGKAAQ